MPSQDRPEDAAPAPAKRRRKAWRKPIAFRPDRRTTASRLAKAYETAVCEQLGVAYAQLPVALRSLIDAAVTAMVRIAIDIDDLTRLAGIQQRSLESLGLIGEGLAARKAADKQAALEAEWKRLGINYKKPGDR